MVAAGSYQLHTHTHSWCSAAGQQSDPDFLVPPVIASVTLSQPSVL